MKELSRFDIGHYVPNTPAMRRWGNRCNVEVNGGKPIVKYFSSEETEMYIRSMIDISPDEEKTWSKMLMGCREGEICLRYNEKNDLIETVFKLTDDVIDIQGATYDLSEFA